MSEHPINYDALVQEALLGVIVNLLTDAAKQGLPGEHHFYIAFDTTHMGVVMPEYLRAQHPKEMTIVLQHQFWDLDIFEDGFSVQLSFHGKPEYLSIPFDALTGFLDPSVQFGLQFKSEAGQAGAGGAQAPSANEAKGAEDQDTDARRGADDGGATIVTLDSFRKS